MATGHKSQTLELSRGRRPANGAYVKRRDEQRSHSRAFPGRRPEGPVVVRAGLRQGKMTFEGLRQSSHKVAAFKLLRFTSCRLAPCGHCHHRRRGPSKQLQRYRGFRALCSREMEQHAMLSKTPTFAQCRQVKARRLPHFTTRRREGLAFCCAKRSVHARNGLGT